MIRTVTLALLITLATVGCTRKTTMTTSGPVMIAAYKIKDGTYDDFLALLKDTEAVYKKHSVLSDQPILRLRSMKDPSYIVEIIHWSDQQALGRVMGNDEIQAKWSQIKAAWEKGDFPLNEVPESSIPWSVLQAIP